MNAQRAARWSGSGICNKRLRHSAPNARYYSLHAHSPRSLTTNGARCLQTRQCTLNIQQTRSISLFGWGGSSTSKPGEFVSAHAPVGTPSDQTFTDTAKSSPASIEQIRAVKASHATSEAPDPSISISTELPHTAEPAVLKHFENAITNPGGHAPEVSEKISQIAEYKGYLKEICGLDYGWGPTAIMENLLETIHITFGQSWAVSIVGIAVAYRAFVLIFVYRGADQSAKMKEMMPTLQPIKDAMQKASATGDLAKRQQLAAELSALNKEAGISYTKLFLPILVQIPLSWGGFRLLRGCATAPVPAFLEESWLWNVDLTMSDPYYAIPLVQGLVLYSSIRLSQKAGVQTMSSGMGAVFMVVLPAVSVLWSTIQPGSVQLFFLVSTSLAGLQAWAFSKNGFRRAIGLMAMPGTGPTPGPTTGAPGGLRRMSGSGKVIDVKASSKKVPAADLSKNRSSIDKMVDFAKSKAKGVKETGLWSSTQEQVEQKMRDRKAAEKRQIADKHEFIRKEQLEYERESRSQAQPLQTTVGPGGMRVIKKKEKSRR